MGRLTRIVWALIVVVALVAAGVGVRAVLRPHGYELTAVFDDVGDLFAQHSVQIADVRVGEVSHIALTNDFRARVTMRIDHDVKVPVGSTAVLRTTSLLGEKFIELRPPSHEAMQQGPFLAAGSRIEKTRAAPELEFVADTAIRLLGAVSASDVATLVDTGAEGFGGQTQQLRSLIADLGTISKTFADRSNQLVHIIDNLDGAASRLGSGSGDLATALENLAQTTTILSNNRQRAVDALRELSRLARAQNKVVADHFDAVNTQVQQVDAILSELKGSQQDISSLLTWLERFVVGIPDVIPHDFTNVYLEGVLRGAEGG